MARSQCSGCSEVFSSETAFNIHRVGSYGDAIYDKAGKNVLRYTKSERRCLSEAEMLAKKLVKNEKGIWTTGEFDAAAKERMKGKSEEEEATTH